MNDSGFAKTPRPPYYAVIFTSLRTSRENDYGKTADRMVDLASQRPGFLGVESVRDGNGLGITVSYWASTEAISKWKAHAEHIVAQETGTRLWYEHYELRVAKVERAYAKEKT